MKVRTGTCREFAHSRIQEDFGEIIPVTGRKDNKKNGALLDSLSVETRREHACGNRSCFSFYALDKFLNELREVELELNDIGRKAFLEAIIGVVPQEEAVENVLHL